MEGELTPRFRDFNAMGFRPLLLAAEKEALLWRPRPPRSSKSATRSDGLH